MCIGIFVLAVHTVSQRPAAVRTFYRPGKYLRCAILLPSAPVANLLLYLTEHIFGNNRFVGVLHTIPFLFWLTPMNEETVDLFQQFAKKMIEQAGKET